MRLDTRHDVLEHYAGLSGKPVPTEHVAMLALRADGLEQAENRSSLTSALQAVPGVVKAHVPTPRTDGPELLPVVVEVREGVDVNALRAAAPGAPLVGPDAMNEAHGEVAAAEQLQLFLRIGLAMALMLALLTRRAAGVVLPLLGAGCGAWWVGGVMGWLGVPLGGPNLLLLPLVVVLGVADSVHLLGAIAARLSSGDERAQAVEQALRDVFWPCLLTSLTTALALAGLLASGSATVRTFAWLSMMGVACSLVSGLVVPAAGMIAGAWEPMAPATGVRTWSRWPALGLVGCATLGVAWLGIDLVPGGELPASHPVAQDHATVDRDLPGLHPVRVVLETGEAGGALEVGAVGELIELHHLLAQEEVVADAGSFVTVLDAFAAKRNKQSEQLVGHATEPERVRRRKFSRIKRPALLLASQLSPVPLLDEDQSAWIIWLRLHDTGVRSWRAPFQRLEEREAKLRHVTLHTSGYVPLALAALERVLPELGRVLGASALALVLTMALATRSKREVGAALASVAAGVACTLGTLGWMGMALNHLNVFVLALVIGIGADAGIHLGGRNGAERAVLTTAAVLVAGFLGVAGSSLPSLVALGLALAVGTAGATLTALAVRR